MKKSCDFVIAWAVRQKYIYFKKAGVTNFAEIIKITIKLIKTTFQNDKLCIKIQFSSLLADITKTANF